MTAIFTAESVALASKYEISERASIDRNLRRAIACLRLAQGAADHMEHDGDLCDHTDGTDVCFDCHDLRKSAITINCFLAIVLPTLPDIDGLPAVDVNNMHGEEPHDDAPAALWLAVTLERATKELHTAGWETDAYGDTEGWTQATRHVVGLHGVVESFASYVDSMVSSWRREPFRERLEDVLDQIQ